MTRFAAGRGCCGSMVDPLRLCGRSIDRGQIMDIRCPVCCEPWEIDTLHEYVDEALVMFPEMGYTFETVRARFISQGCGSAFQGWKVSCYPDKSGRGLIYSEMGDLFGDDVDGYASFCEDVDALGGLS